MLPMSWRLMRIMLRSKSPEERAARMQEIVRVSDCDGGLSEIPEEPGIYCVINLITGKCYVGLACPNMRKRCKSHNWQLRAGNSSNWLLDQAAAEVPPNSFYFIALRKFSHIPKRGKWDWELLAIEHGLATLFQAVDERYGYNLMSGSVRTRASRFRERERKLLRTGRGYSLLPSTQICDQINHLLLESWEPTPRRTEM